MSKYNIQDDYRDCEVCTKPFNIFHDVEGLLDLQEILDCTDQQLAEWQNKNPDIDLTNYFCSECATDTIKNIEGLEKNGGFSSPEHLESYHEKK
jgi:hypothetical protein|tara:strand:+ start:13 stop:294 length:282 start_codon:yes stop_codon:yes gene_type:complete